MCNVWTQLCSWVQCASNEDKIKQREDKVFVAISESLQKFVYFGRFIFIYLNFSSERLLVIKSAGQFRAAIEIRAAIESAGNEEDKRCQQRSWLLSKQRSRSMDNPLSSGM